MALLNTPITLHNLSLPNRLVMPPMATAKADEAGCVTQQLCEYYAARAQGGCIGLIITEHSFVRPDGKARDGQLSIAQDSDIEGLARLVDTIHQHDTKVIAQINHAGGSASYTGCQERISASAVKMPHAELPLPRQMTQEDIAQVTKAFALAAQRARTAGYDGIEIHSAHGYLLNQFYSPLTNHRTDAYTGSTLAGRIRLHLEVIDAVRKQVGKDFCVALRLGASDYRQGGTTLADSIQAAQAFARAGIDLLDISGGFCGYSCPDTTEQGYFSELTDKIKQQLDIPVILTGGITDVHAAERLLQEEKADCIGVGRAILQDAAWARQAMHTLQATR